MNVLDDHYKSKPSSCWYVIPGMRMEFGLEELKNDNDSTNLIATVKGYDEVHLYFEHLVETPEELIGEEAIKFFANVEKETRESEVREREAREGEAEVEEPVESDGYHTEELKSLNGDESGNEEEGVQYTMFNEGDKLDLVTIELGMVFSS
ncbi:hypothetical protein CRG98_018900 [Punica granatum]|uniref:Uncharacterized protein n=1 Tax=Punica granatum TaxID=22663 RepID=A0A2I0JY03_PUNGR|nr:hypothetical protein CRG98_018900 [Punica granatum]